MFNAAILGFGIWMMIAAFFYPDTRIEAVVMFAIGVSVCAPVLVIYFAQRPRRQATAVNREDLIAEAAEQQEKRIQQLRGKSETKL